MKNIITLIFALFVYFSINAQTNIPFPGFFSEITNVTNAGVDYELTISVNDQSGRFNGNSVDTTSFVLWQNCGRYTIDSIVQKFPSQLVIHVGDPDGNGAPIQGFSAVLKETPQLGVGFYISGILDSRNQCMLSYYADRFKTSETTPGDFDIFYKRLSNGEDYSIPIDTISKYDAIFVETYPTEANASIISFPDYSDTTLWGKTINIVALGPELNDGQTILQGINQFELYQYDCQIKGARFGNDTLYTSTQSSQLVTYHLTRFDKYVRYCDYHLVDNLGNIISSGDTLNDFEFYYGNTQILNGDTIPVIPQDSIYRYLSTNGSTSAHITANGEGVTISENSGAGEVTILVPNGVEVYYVNLFMPSSVTDAGDYHIVLDYAGLRNYNTTKNNLNVPIIRSGLDNYSTASRANPANVSENGGNSANTVTYGVSAFGGGDGSDLTMTLINFSLGINQMCRIDFNAIK